MVRLNLYNHEDEAFKVLECRHIKWATFKRAIKLKADIEQNHLGEADMLDAVADIVADVFKDQATLDEIENSATCDEIFTAFYNVLLAATVLQKQNFRQGTT